jgi:hypothetical protein
MRWYDGGSFLLSAYLTCNGADGTKEAVASAFYPTICTLFFYQDWSLALLQRTRVIVSAWMAVRCYLSLNCYILGIFPATRHTCKPSRQSTEAAGSCGSWRVKLFPSVSNYDRQLFLGRSLESQSRSPRVSQHKAP